MTKFKILFRDNAENAEVVDSIADAFGVVFEVEKSLKDGWQLTDLLTYIKQEPTVREVINDFPVFLEQFLKLTPETATNAVQGAYTRSKAQYGAIGKYGEKFYTILLELANTYSFGILVTKAAKQQLEVGKQQLERWKAIFAPAQA